MNSPLSLNQSVAVFDSLERLVDWNAEFALEFSDAAPLLAPGIFAAEIQAACLLPERALDLSWLGEAQAPPVFEYINRRQCVRVTQCLSANGHAMRIAQGAQGPARLHHALADDNAELLRSAALQISAAVLKRRQQERLRLHELALKDGLTGVANRRYFDELLAIEWQRCQQAGWPLSLIFIDIDFFKRYNDVYGHLCGDDCLKRIAATLRSILHRPRDLVARYGGEEFVCLLPETELDDAARKADELERAVRALGLANAKSDVAPVVTISLGVASARTRLDCDATALITAADRLLYRAKATGRGRVCAAYLPDEGSMPEG